MKDIKVGDLVKILPGTEDARLPKNRMGVVINNDPGKQPGQTTTWNVHFINNGVSMRFHEMFIEVIKE